MCFIFCSQPRAISWSGPALRRRGRMNVPLFPAPPALEGAATTLRSGQDVEYAATATTTATTAPQSYSCRGRHAASSPVKLVRTNSCPGNGNFRRRSHRVGRFVNVVHPKGASREPGRARARVTELRVKMTERREDEEDDADVVCASGKFTIKTNRPLVELLHFLKYFFQYIKIWLFYTIFFYRINYFLDYHKNNNNNM